MEDVIIIEVERLQNMIEIFYRVQNADQVRIITRKLREEFGDDVAEYYNTLAFMLL